MASLNGLILPVSISRALTESAQIQWNTSKLWLLEYLQKEHIYWMIYINTSWQKLCPRMTTRTWSTCIIQWWGKSLHHWNHLPWVHWQLCNYIFHLGLVITEWKGFLGHWACCWLGLHIPKLLFVPFMRPSMTFSQTNHAVMPSSLILHQYREIWPLPHFGSWTRSMDFNSTSAPWRAHTCQILLSLIWQIEWRSPFQWSYHTHVASRGLIWQPCPSNHHLPRKSKLSSMESAFFGGWKHWLRWKTSVAW